MGSKAVSDPDVVIRVEGLGKKYALHHDNSERYTALRDVVARQAKIAGRLLNPFTLAGQLRRAQRQAAEPSEEAFWALKDVSFEIRRGERVGIIGRNGAGKSTLLKILSRITEPTTGRVEIRGRVASLLEVGTGFHPELTGRENIYLNGAILGMTRGEIRTKFDEIVDFAEVERFLDTPVKRYSSGMYVRLAFAVAAHLEPDILVVDEVLAVGDAAFQKKCIGKMRQTSTQESKTILFVSHQMPAISALTASTLYMDKGKVVLQGETQTVIHQYLQSLGKPNFPSYSISTEAKTNHDAFIASTRVVTSSGGSIHEFLEPISFEFEIYQRDKAKGRTFSFQLLNQLGIPATHCWVFDSETVCMRNPGVNKLICVIEKPSLNIGRYRLTAYLAGEPGEPQLDKVENICEFTIVNTSVNRSYPWSSEACVYYEKASWYQDGKLIKPKEFTFNKAGNISSSDIIQLS